MSNLESRLSAPRIVQTDGDLLRLIKDRIAELGTTHACIESVSGASPGYISKITGEPPQKRVQVFTAFLILQALGIQLEATISPDFAQRFAHRIERRRMRPAQARMANPEARITKLTPDFLAHRSRLGGQARAQKLSGEELSRIGRAAINARWQRHRDAKQAS